MHFKLYFSSTLLFLLSLFVLSTPLLAQGDIDYIEDEGRSLWDEEIFSDSVGGDGSESEFDSGSGQYISEEEALAQERRFKKNRAPVHDLAAAIDQDKELGLANIKYGLFTGLTLGGWFALWQGTNARDNARYLGMGMVLGSLLGVSIGFKTVINPPVVSGYFIPPQDDREGMHSVAMNHSRFKERKNSSLGLFKYSLRF